MNNKNDRFKLSPEQKKTEGEKALAEYRAKEEAINKNTERLRALRLAHEAQNPPAPPTGKAAKAAKGPRAQAAATKKDKPATLSQFLKRQTDSGRGT